MEFAGRSPLVRPINRGSALLFAAGSRAIRFTVNGVNHQHLFCLCAVESCQLGEDQLEYTLVRPAVENGCRGFCGVRQWWGASPPAQVVQEDVDVAAQHLALVHTAHTRSLGEKSLILSAWCSLSRNQVGLPFFTHTLDDPLSAEEDLFFSSCVLSLRS